VANTEIGDQEHHILMVDDDPDDIFAISRSLAKSRSNIKLSSASGGKEMFEWLQDEANQLPDLILLDINMPRMNGYEILKKMKSVTEWEPVPIYVFSTSDHSADKLKCLELGAAGFVTKFASMDALSAWLSEIEIILQKLGQTPKVKPIH